MARIIEHIACWGSYGGTEVLYALCADGTVWRCARDRDVGGDPVWRQVPAIDDAVAPDQVLGFTFEPPQPAEEAVPAAVPQSEVQW